METTKQENEAKESMKEMMNSCYVYGGIEKSDYNYERYILPYRSRLTEKAFNETYKEQKLFLEGFEIEHNTYTDCEGLTYNSLKPKL